MTKTQTLILELRTLLESLSDLTDTYQDLSSGLNNTAQQSTLVQGVTDIRSDIANIDIDTSALATEANATANKQEILAKLDELPTVVEQAQQIGVLQEKVDAFDEQVAGVYDYLKEVAGEGPMPAVEDINHIEETIETIVDGIVSVPLTAMTVPNTPDVTVVDYSHILFTGDTQVSFSSHTYLISVKAPKGMSNVRIMTNNFNGCSALRHLDISGYDMSNVINMTNFFIYCYELQTLVGGATYEDVVAEDIKVFDGLNVTVTNSYVSQTQIGRASLRAIINGLADRTGQSACTFTMGATQLAKLSAEDIAVATAKNWTLN